MKSCPGKNDLGDLSKGSIFSRARDKSGGNWYRQESQDREGWLCPGLFKYFEEAFYAKVKPLWQEVNDRGKSCV